MWKIHDVEKATNKTCNIVYNSKKKLKKNENKIEGNIKHTFTVLYFMFVL